MPKAKTNRKRLFRAALAISETTAAQWAESHGITAQWLSMVLSEKHESAKLTEKIDAFIHEHLSEPTALVS